MFYNIQKIWPTLPWTIHILLNNAPVTLAFLLLENSKLFPTLEPCHHVECFPLSFVIWLMLSHFSCPDQTNNNSADKFPLTFPFKYFVFYHHTRPVILMELDRLSIIFCNYLAIYLHILCLFLLDYKLWEVWTLSLCSLLYTHYLTLLVT